MARTVGWSQEEEETLAQLIRSSPRKTRLELARELTAITGIERSPGSIHAHVQTLRAKGVDLTSAASVTSTNVDPLIARLVEVTKKKPKGLEELCDTFDLSPRRMRELVIEAQNRGFAVSLEDDHVGSPPQREGLDTKEITISQPGERHALAIVGDIHFGSKHHLSKPFLDFCGKAYEAGVREFLQVGDLLDGTYSHSLYEQSARGFEEQVDVAFETLPKYKGVTWHFIQGNHDETFRQHTGLDVGRVIVDRFNARKRQDIVYHGARSAYMRMRAKGERRGLIVQLWHPGDKGAAYALSYGIQRKIEGYAVGQKPDLLAVGHWHQMGCFLIRGVYSISAGCWQGAGSSFAKSLKTAPAIGSWVVEWSVTKEGTIREFSPTWHGHLEKEVVREVGLG
jgi:hypothetical protein